MANEENVIPPDIMYDQMDVVRTCYVCHAPLLGEHPPVDLTVATPMSVCTSCHGSHSVDNPRRRWDKTTRKLL
jgi:hypothetical protein